VSDMLDPSQIAALDPYSRAVYLAIGELLTKVQLETAIACGIPPSLLASAATPCLPKEANLVLDDGGSAAALHLPADV
jgi:hypothetical protein